MSKQELVGIYYKLDKNKFKLLDNGISFQLIIRDGGAYLNTGIGTGGDMTMMNLYNLLTMYYSAASCDIETFADSVKEGIIKAHEEGWFTIQDNGGNTCES